MVAGNHDLCIKDMTTEEVQDALSNATYLFDSGVTIEGTRTRVCLSYFKYSSRLF